MKPNICYFKNHSQMPSWFLHFMLVFFSFVVVLVAQAVHSNQVLLFFNVVSILVFLAFIYYIAKTDITFLTFNAFLILNYIWFIGSLILLEGGAYTPELQLVGELTGSTSRFVFIAIIFLQFSVVGWRLVKSIDKTLCFKESLCLICFYIGLQLVILAVYFIYGTALGLSVDRIDYRNNVAPGGYFQLITMLTFLGYPLGRLRSLNVIDWRILDLLFLSSLVLLVLGGEKFSFLFLSICLYRVAHVSKFTFRLGVLFKIAIGILLLLYAIYMLAEIQYSGIVDKVSGKAVSDLVFDRIAQQAQLNYYFDRLAFVAEDRSHDAIDFIVNELNETPSHPQGISYLMSIATPGSIYRVYSESNVTFGDGFPGILYLYFSWWSFPLAGLLGVFFGVASKLCSKALLEGRLISCMLLVYLFYNLFLSVFLNGEFYLIFSFSIVKVAAVFLLISIFTVRVSLGRGRSI